MTHRLFDLFPYAIFSLLRSSFPLPETNLEVKVMLSQRVKGMSLRLSNDSRAPGADSDDT